MISKEEIESCMQLLEIHPQGTHFCMTNKQPGYAFDKERMRDLCRLALWAMEAKDSLGKFANHKTRESASELEKWINEAYAFEAREALAKFPKDEP